MNTQQKQQLQHFMQEFTKLANSFFEEGNMELAQYWKGQVMGIANTSLNGKISGYILPIRLGISTPLLQ